MPVDIDELIRKHQQLKRKMKGGSIPNLDWEGSIWVRILPPWKLEASFYAEFPVHYLPMPDAPSKSRPWQCLRYAEEQALEDCPLCQIERALRDKGGSDTNEAREMRRKLRFAMNVLVRDTGEVNVLVCGPKLFTQILALFANPHYGNITKPDTGTDLTLVKERTGSGRKDVDYQTQTVPNSKPLKDSEWKGKLYDLDKVFRVWTSEQLIAAYKGEEVEGDPDLESEQGDGSGVAMNEDEAERREMRDEGMVQGAPQQARPRCFGSYDKGDASCVSCAWAEECRAKGASKQEAPKQDDVNSILDEIHRGSGT